MKGDNGVASARVADQLVQTLSHFGVDATIVGSYDGKLRPMVREVFEQLRADGHQIYIWSGVGLRWLEIDYDENLSRWLIFVKWLLAIPHLIVLAFLGIGHIFFKRLPIEPSNHPGLLFTVFLVAIVVGIGTGMAAERDLFHSVLRKLPGTASMNMVENSSTVENRGRPLASPPSQRKLSLPPARSSIRPITRNAASDTNPWLTIWKIAPVEPLALSAKIPITIRLI